MHVQNRFTPIWSGDNEHATPPCDVDVCDVDADDQSKHNYTAVNYYAE